MLTLEDILHNYKFLNKNKKAFRITPKMIDELPEYCTKEGAKAYNNLTTLLYDIAQLTDTLKEVNIIIDNLDFIIANDNY